MKTILNYMPVDTSNIKRNHLLFLDKNGYSIKTASTPEELRAALGEPVLAAVVHAEEDIQKVADIDSVISIIVLSKGVHFPFKLQEKYKDLTNVIFFRSESDPIDTILETVRFVEKFSIETE